MDDSFWVYIINKEIYEYGFFEDEGKKKLFSKTSKTFLHTFYIFNVNNPPDLNSCIYYNINPNSKDDRRPSSIISSDYNELLREVKKYKINNL